MQPQNGGSCTAPETLGDKRRPRSLHVCHIVRATTVHWQNRPPKAPCLPGVSLSIKRINSFLKKVSKFSRYTTPSFAAVSARKTVYNFYIDTSVTEHRAFFATHIPRATVLRSALKSPPNGNATRKTSRPERTLYGTRRAHPRQTFSR